jgi:hypothetical protein
VLKGAVRRIFNGRDYSWQGSLSFFLIQRATVPPINVPITVKDLGTFWLGGIGLFAVNVV